MAKIEEIGGSPRLTVQTKSTVAIIFVVIVGFIVLSMGYTGVDNLEMGKAAVIIKNVQRKPSVRTRPGLVAHLPFGMTEVYKFPVQNQLMRMQGKSDGGTIRVKTRDGSNVDFGAEIRYRVMETDAALMSLAKSFGRDEKLDAVQQLILALARSDIREILGALYIVEITDAAQRQKKTIEIRTLMNEQLAPYGVYVDTVSLSTPILNTKYAQLIKDRKSANQELANQESAQESALRKQEQAIATATREKDTAIEEEKGRQNKRIIEAKSHAEQRVARADGDADKIRREGDKAYEVALNEAQAFRAEGLSKAEGIRKMAEAYENGGMALVREALAQKYLGAEINGRPFNLSNVVERLALEPGVGAAAAKSAKGGTEQ